VATRTRLISLVFLLSLVYGAAAHADAPVRPTERVKPAPEVNPNAVVWRDCAPACGDREGRPGWRVLIWGRERGDHGCTCATRPSIGVCRRHQRTTDN